MVERCGAEPCSAELWRTETDEQATVLLLEDRLEWRGHTWPAKWKRLGTELTFCLEHNPLASPPGADPGGFRMLSAKSPPAGDRDAQWILHFSGENLCELSGELLLSGQRDQADSRALSSGGLAWDNGGREHALGILKALYERLEEEAEARQDH